MTARLKKGASCPICQKPVATGFQPFCSKRCADRDLNRWIDGGYRIPTEECPGEGTATDEARADEEGGDEY